MSGYKGKKTKPAVKKAPAAPKKPQGPKMPSEWLYVNSQEVSARQIYELFAEDPMTAPEIWEELDILEIGMTDAGSVDMEQIECEFDDEIGMAFIQEHAIKVIYEVTIMPDHFEKAKGVMEKIMDRFGGFFCGDTEDFQPQVRR